MKELLHSDEVTSKRLTFILLNGCTTNDDILYNFTRANDQISGGGFISLIGISNSLTFKEKLDPRVRSSLSERKKDEGNNNNGSSSTYDYLSSAQQVEYRMGLVEGQVGVQSICLSRRGVLNLTHI
ncbi:MAG: hypothetical protein WBE34_12560 [Candidatus Nitrosopolaris sp.]